MNKIKDKIERCGFCGSYFRGNKYLTTDELNKLTKEEKEMKALGYCPNADQEDQQQNPSQPQYVTREMAIDAEDLSLEGERV